MRLRKPHHREFKETCPRSWNKWDGRYSNTGILAPEFVRLTSHAMLLLLISNNTQKPQRWGDSRGPAWGRLGRQFGEKWKQEIERNGENISILPEIFIMKNSKHTENLKCNEHSYATYINILPYLFYLPHCIFSFFFCYSIWK